MENNSIVQGFSKLSIEGKIDELKRQGFLNESQLKLMQQFNPAGSSFNGLHTSIAENALTNFVLPFSVVPNMLINNKMYCVPVVTEESSVVAAAAAAAKFWAQNGGFKTKVISTTKVGQIHFLWPGNFAEITTHFTQIELLLRQSVSAINANMAGRGGGIKQFELFDFTHCLEHYYQLRVQFNTADAMGANYINTCLEFMAQALRSFFNNNFIDKKKHCDIIMAILSNYTPACLAECLVECPIENLAPLSAGYNAETFATRFFKAVKIAEIDSYRAVTHNKGIFNGIDAVVLATGNDYRAVEACGHAYAARNGSYSSLSNCTNHNGMFRFKLQVPLAIGTVGGLTSLHPLAALALEMLKKPGAEQLMQIAVALGMANHFSAITALITTGIQAGHMKMHLSKILKHLKVTNIEYEQAVAHFANANINHRAVADFISSLRK